MKIPNSLLGVAPVLLLLAYLLIQPPAEYSDAELPSESYQVAMGHVLELPGLEVPPDSTLRKAEASVAERGVVTGDCDAIRMGSLGVTFTNWDERDHLILVATDGAGQVLDESEVLSDRLVFLNLPAGSVNLALITSLGKVLAERQGIVLVDGRLELAMGWPILAESPRYGSLKGTLKLDEVAQAYELFPRLSLILTPLGNTQSQQRAKHRTIRLRVQRLSKVSPDTLAWERAKLPIGGYRLEVSPIGYSRIVHVTADSGEELLELDPGELGHAFLTFVDPSGTAVNPAQVTMRPLVNSGSSAALVLQLGKEPDAYDLIATPGEYRIDIVDPVFGTRTFQYPLVKGINSALFELVPVQAVEVQLNTNGALLALGRLVVESLAGGNVVSTTATTGLSPLRKDVVLLQVDGPGTYLFRYDERAEFRLEVNEDTTSGQWDLGDLIR